MKRKCAFVLASVLILAASNLGFAVPVPVQWEENGHWYEVVVIPEPGISWSQAQAAAVAQGGYLATITSAEENDFVFGLTVDTPGAWIYSAEWAIGPCLGGYQERSAPDYGEPSGGWRWVTGEPWGFTNWLAGQPDNWLDFEDRLIFWGRGQKTPTWNDFNGDSGVRMYVVEYIPEPTTVLLLGLGGLVLRRRRR